MAEIRPGRTISFMGYAGRGLRGPEYRPMRGKIVMRSGDDRGWVVSMGGRHGRPVVVDDKDVLTKGHITTETRGERALGMGRGARYMFRRNPGSWGPRPYYYRVEGNPYLMRRASGGFRDMSIGWYGTREKAETERQKMLRSGRYIPSELYVEDDRPRVRAKNPELLVINPYQNPGGRKMRHRLRRRVRRARRNARARAGNPALYKKVRGRYVSYGERVRQELSKLMKRKRYRTLKTAMPVARRKALAWLKKGVVYHQGLRLRVTGTRGYRSRKAARRRRRKGAATIGHFKAFTGRRRRAANRRRHRIRRRRR